MTISERITDFYSRTDERYTRAELHNFFPDIKISVLGNVMIRLYRRGELDRAPVKGSRHQANAYFRIGAKPKSEPYMFIKPAESLISGCGDRR